MDRRTDPGPAVAPIRRVCKAARGYWNDLVAVQRWAEVEIRHGRQSSVVAKYCDLLQGKALTGRAVSIARKRAGERGISLEDAIRELRDEKADELDAGVVGKNGKRIRFLSRRKLARECQSPRSRRSRSREAGYPNYTAKYCERRSAGAGARRRSRLANSCSARG